MRIGIFKNCTVCCLETGKCFFIPLSDSSIATHLGIILFIFLVYSYLLKYICASDVTTGTPGKYYFPFSKQWKIFFFFP